MKMKKAFRKSILFKFLAFVFMLLPMLILIIVKRDTYFVEGEEVKLSIGCILTFIFVLMCFLGKLKNLNSIIILAILWILTFLMQTIILDVLIIIPCAILGNMFYLVFNYFYKYYHDIYIVGRNAKIDQASREEVKKEVGE